LQANVNFDFVLKSDCSEGFNFSDINPFTNEKLDLLGTVPKQVCHFSSLSIFCLGCNMMSRRAARCLIVLHPKIRYGMCPKIKKQSKYIARSRAIGVNKK